MNECCVFLALKNGRRVKVWRPNVSRIETQTMSDQFPDHNPNGQIVALLVRAAWITGRWLRALLSSRVWTVWQRL
jgi:hypothetical protein